MPYHAALADPLHVVAQPGADEALHRVVPVPTPQAREAMNSFGISQAAFRRR